jgi:hypothetical protein
MKTLALFLGIAIFNLSGCGETGTESSETSEMVDVNRPVGNKSFTIIDGRDRIQAQRMGEDENGYYAVVDGDRDRVRPSWAWDASRNAQADVEVSESQFGGEYKGPIWRALGRHSWPIGNHVRGSVHLAAAEQLADVNWRYFAEIEWGYRIDSVESWCRDDGTNSGVATVISFFAYCGWHDGVSLSEAKRCLADRPMREYDSPEMERCPAIGDLHWTAFEGGHGSSVVRKHAVEPFTAATMTCSQARRLKGEWNRAPRLTLSVSSDEFRGCARNLRLGFLFGMKGAGSRVDIQFGKIDVTRTNAP